MSKKGITYLAIPYTWSPKISFVIANKVAAKLIENGCVVFSPISHSHPISEHLPDDVAFSHETWMKQDLPVLQKCDRLMLVLIGENGLNLIKESRGCQEELSEAKKLNIPVEYYLYPDE